MVVKFFSTTPTSVAVVGSVSFLAALGAVIKFVFGINICPIWINNNPIYGVIDTDPNKIIDDEDQQNIEEGE